jgi:hypothetical protein
MRIRNRPNGGVRLDCSWEEYQLLMGSVGSLATIMGRQADKQSDAGKQADAERDNAVAIALGKLAVALTAHVEAMKAKHRRHDAERTETRNAGESAAPRAAGLPLGEPL